jgi:hypothetical protein
MRFRDGQKKHEKEQHCAGLNHVENKRKKRLL